MANWDGTNLDDITDALRKVVAAYEKLNDAVCNQVQTQFVKGFETTWACPLAQRYFGSFKELFDAVIVDSNSRFDSIVKSMNSAAAAYAASDEYSWSPVNININETRINIDGIQENINGDRGIDPNEAPNVLAKLDIIQSNAKSALVDAQAAVSVCGFLGGEKQSTITESLAKINRIVESAIDNSKETAKIAVNNTLQEHGELNSNVTSAFAGNGN